jgi:hypothetical protein
MPMLTDPPPAWRVSVTHTSICMVRHQMSPEPRTCHLMIGRSSSSACMRLISALSELQVPYLRLFSATRLPSPAQHWRHIHMLRLTPTRMHAGCKPHACKPSSYIRSKPLALGRCRNIYYAEYVPDANVLRLAESGGVVSTNTSSLPISEACPSHGRFLCLTPSERGLHVQV